MDDLFSQQSRLRPGYRLHKLEVFNWGTFDSTRGNVYTFRPDGQTGLLIGKNGSGKSTLVDALLTLLVRPVVRNYNVAAGAKKQERDERSYIRGAHGRVSREEDNRADVKLLRPGNSHYSVLLATFRNEDNGRAFTIAQVLYLNTEGRAEKVYCFANGERGIAADCAGLASTEKLRQQMEQRGFRATAKYNDYHRWFVKATGAQPKAMDMFNQTVAVKDIQSLTDFIRAHMLEAKPWSDKVDSLLNHFIQLSEAHQSLLKARRQTELLEPVETRGAEYRGRAEQLAQTQRLVDAADSYFRQQTINLFQPECEQWKIQLGDIRQQKESLAHEIEDNEQERRRLQNEIEQTGGERLRQIPLLIKQHETLSAAARDAHDRYVAALRGAGIDRRISDADAFARVRAGLPDLVSDVDKEIEALQASRDEQVIERGEQSRALETHQRELAALERRQGNLPEYLAEVRRQLAADLQIAESELPFVSELIKVRPDEQAWEASIEMVLRGFALSLLVPPQHYRLVSGYIEKTRLVDERGRGQRLVYLKVGQQANIGPGPTPHAQSLLRKIAFREGHSLLPWLKAELESRFNYVCCDSVQQFQQSSGKALTRQRHVKIHDVRHEKDDRSRTIDPHNFVLGWDNREKRRRLAREIQRVDTMRRELDQQIARRETELASLRTREVALKELQRFSSFDVLDYARHNREINALELERQRLEDQNDAIQHLKGRLAEANSRRDVLNAQRDEAVGRERELENEIASGERLVENARKILQRREVDGALATHAECFAELDEAFADEPLTAANVLSREAPFMNQRRQQAQRLQAQVTPLERELCSGMNRFLREFKEERDDLDARVEYLESFLDLLKQIREEDLPRHQERFKNRLNEKVTQEIGLFHGALQAERSEIEAKIDMLNASLRQVEYRPGTHMRLEAQPVRDREISEFREQVAECLAGTFEGSFEADEARYLRIEKLVARLREEKRWRDKVTDVRRWFDFAAREIDDATGEERGYYADSTGQSGGEKAKLAFTILVAAIAYQYDIDPRQPTSDRFHFVVVDEMFSKVDDQYAEYALELFKKFGLQLLIVAPLDAKALVTQPYVGCYLQVVKDDRTNRSEVISITAHEFEETMMLAGRSSANGAAAQKDPAAS